MAVLKSLAAGVARATAGAIIASAALFAGGAVQAQTPVKFTLDWKFEGPAAPFVVAIDHGYYKAEGLDVTMDTAGGSLEPLNRLASGTYDIGFGDINSLIKFRDANPGVPIKAIFMVYNKPPFSIVARKSRGVTKPKDLEGKKLGAPAPDGAYAQWPIFVKANNIDAAKVTIENVGFPVREPMLAAGQVDAITGFSFSSYINLKDRGVPADDIVVLLMADYGVNLYGNAIIVNPKFAAEKPEAVKGFLRAFLKGLKDTVKDPDQRGRLGDQAQRRRQERRRARAAADGDQGQHPDAGSQSERLRRRRSRAARHGDRPDRAHLQVQEPKPKAGDIFDPSFLPPTADRN